MLVTATRQSASANGRPHAQHSGDMQEPAVASTALTPIAPTFRDTAVSYSRRPDASFVAQLIATAERIPETRTLRRASNATAQAAYHATVAQNGLRPAPAGTQLSRDI
jgi:hypothetical protein